MKKSLLLTALAVAATMTAGAKTADELRVYINPGHGSWTPNDRPNVIVGHDEYTRYGTDTTNFFETNTNLRKGFGVLERLIDYGLKFDRTLNQTGERWQIGAARDLSNNIVMSHVKCGPYHDDNGTANQLGDNKPADIYYYNRDLTEICEEVEANNFDMFISIHSNAATEGTTTNYPLFLYRGYDTPKDDTGLSLAQQTESRKMADLCWDYAISNPHMVWTSYKSSKNLRGDINFYGSGSIGKLGYRGYLGVLKHGTPGFLVEGYFHTYQPARHRAMNWDVDRIEGIGYARGIADYFGLDKEKFGTIYGIVRDLHERFTHQYYKPNPLSDDIFLPINGCTVTLMKDGEPVAEYTTDENYNGAFVFDRVEPGKYTIAFEHPDYKAIDPIEVEVKAAANVYPTASLEGVNYQPPTKVYETYPDPAATIPGIIAADEYAFTAAYTDEPIAELEGLKVRRTVAHDGKLYVLALDKDPVYAQVVPADQKPKSTIFVYDLAEKKVVANVSTEGTYGSILDVSDIQVSADGYLLASNQTKNQYSADQIENLPDGTKEPRGTAYIYKWANDENGLPTGNPEQWMSTTQTGRWYRTYAGATFAYDGTTVDGKIILAQPSITAPNHVMRWTAITVTNGMSAGCADILHTGDNIGEAQYGEGYRFITNPANTDNFLTVGPAVGAVERDFIMDDKMADLATGNELFAGIAGNIGAFKYAGASYLVAPEADGSGVRVIDVTAGIANAKAVGVLGNEAAKAPAAQAEEGETPAFTYCATAGEVEAEYDVVNEKYTSACINLYMIRDGKVTKLTTKDTKQPFHKPAFAYNLKSEKGENNVYTLNFKSTGDADNALLVLTDPDGKEISTELGAVKKGDNSFTYDANDLEADKSHKWAVRIQNKDVTEANISATTGVGGSRAALVVFTDPEYPEVYGKVVIGRTKNGGIDIYNAEGELEAEKLHANCSAIGGTSANNSCTMDGKQRGNEAVLASWGDAAYGVVAFDLTDLNQEPYSVFEGTKQSSGKIMNGDVATGSGTPCVAFYGKGDDTDMYIFDEDIFSNHLAVSHIGANKTVGTALEDLGFGGLLANTNVTIWPVEGHGLFLSQVRASGMESGTPGLSFYDPEEMDVTWKAADMIDVDPAWLSSASAGVCVNPAGDLLAVATYTGFEIMKLSWDGNKPVLDKYMTIESPYANGQRTNIQFDVTNTLHVANQTNGYYTVALPAKAPVAHTAAHSLDVIANESGVENIAVDATPAVDGEAVYYNLNGVRVAADNMAPGVYVKVVGNTATKVVVK